MYNGYFKVTSNERNYYVPFYLYDNSVYELANNTNVEFSFAVRKEYQAYLPSEENLDILQDIGLINIPEKHDEVEIYALAKFDTSITVEPDTFHVDSLYDDNKKCRYIPTGNITFHK